MKRAAQIQRDRDNQHMATQHTKLTEFKVGSYVLLQYPDSQLKKGPPSKLMTNLKGPYKVLRQLKQGNYIVENLTTGKDERTHISRLRPFYYDQRYINPRDVANKDRQLSEVQDILQHEGTRAQPKTLKFLVRWSPVNDAQSVEEWLSYTEVKNTTALHMYLIKHRMRSLIPAVYKQYYTNVA